MKSSSLCLKDLLRVLTVVLCSVMVVVMVSGCGGSSVDSLVKEHKELTDAALKAKTPDDIKAVKDKQDALKKKIDALSNDQKIDFMKKIAG